VQLESRIQAIQQDLAASSRLGDEAVRDAAERLIEALGATLHLHLLDLLGEAALEIGGQLDAAHVEVRLSGREPELVVVSDETSEPGAVALGDEHMGRISLRLPESLKEKVEAAADREAISTNAWLVRAIARVLDSPSARRSRNRLQGYAQG
jgi:hypothetical protein